MRVVKPGEIAPLKRQMRIAIVVPDPPAGGSVNPVQLPGNVGMGVFQKCLERNCTHLTCGTIPDEVVVVGKHRPGFKRPPVLTGQADQAVEGDIQPLRRIEELSPIKDSRGDEVNPGGSETMRRSMGPVAGAGTGFLV